MPFSWAIADSAGAMVTASQTVLSPSPTRVEYPVDIAGSVVETASGVVVVQQPSKDPRRRAWIWQGYPGWWSRTADLWDQLTPLRSKTRISAGQGSPYVYLKDTETGLFRRQVLVPGTATAGAAGTMTDSGQSWVTNAYAGYYVEILSGTGPGQRRKILSNTGTVLTITPNWGVNPASGSKYNILGWVDDWFQVRVVNVARKLRDDGGLVKYDEIRLEFAVTDANWNATG